MPTTRHPDRKLDGYPDVFSWISRAESVWEDTGCLCRHPSPIQEAIMREKRKWPRLACLERCTVQSCAMNAIPSQVSRVLNFSHNGLMLETDGPLRLGERVRISIPSPASDKVLRGIEQREGTVRWCSRGPRSFSGCYEAGIEIPGLIASGPAPAHRP